MPLELGVDVGVGVGVVPQAGQVCVVPHSPATVCPQLSGVHATYPAH